MVVTGIEIAALVAAIISAFNAAHQLLTSHKEKSKEKKKEKTAAKNSRILDGLEGSLANGMASIQQEYNRYHDALGPRFGVGDGRSFSFPSCLPACLNSAFPNSTFPNPTFPNRPFLATSTLVEAPSRSLTKANTQKQHNKHSKPYCSCRKHFWRLCNQLRDSHLRG
jgi:hypothetical protein